VKKLRRCKKTD